MKSLFCLIKCKFFLPLFIVSMFLFLFPFCIQAAEVTLERINPTTIGLLALISIVEKAKQTSNQPYVLQLIHQTRIPVLSQTLKEGMNIHLPLKALVVIVMKVIFPISSVHLSSR